LLIEWRGQLLLSSSFSLLLLLSGLVVIVSSTLDTSHEATGQQTTTTTATAAEKKKDIFKVILTVDGLDPNSGDVATIVSVNGESRVKLFDDTKTYIQSINANSTADGSGGIIEYVATFPNSTVKADDEYKACALLIKDSNLICETGNNSRALRPEFIDLHIQEEQPIITEAATTTTEAAQAASITDEEEEQQ
jgi:hypothetical protein